MYRSTRLLPLIVVICAVCMIMLPASAQPPIGGDQGWYAVHCNVDGASVYFDSTLEGVIESGILYVPAYVTGTPYKTFTVTKDGYNGAYGTIPSVPGKGEVLDLYATLNPLSTTQPTPVGGDIGWYVVHCNVNGATVMFDNEVKGVISQGTLTVQVYTTGTPYRTLTVTMPGYTTFTDSIDQFPAKGQQVDLYATLNPLPTTQPTLIGGDIGWYVVHCNVNGATVMFNNEVKGVISQGTLTVQVYTTGTPYQTFTVTMPGYSSFTGSIDQFPAKGQQVDLYATLNPLSPTPLPTTTKLPFPVGPVFLALIAGIVVYGMKSRK